MKKCKFCGTKNEDDCNFCKHCGYPLPKKSSPRITLGGIIIAIFVLVGVISKKTSSNEDSSSSPSSTPIETTYEQSNSESPLNASSMSDEYSATRQDSYDYTETTEVTSPVEQMTSEPTAIEIDELSTTEYVSSESLDMNADNLSEKERRKLEKQAEKEQKRLEKEAKKEQKRLEKQSKKEQKRLEKEAKKEQNTQ